MREIPGLYLSQFYIQLYNDLIMLTSLYVRKTYNHHMNVHHGLIDLEKGRFEPNVSKSGELFHIAKKNEEKNPLNKVKIGFTDGVQSR